MNIMDKVTIIHITEPTKISDRIKQDEHNHQHKNSEQLAKKQQEKRQASNNGKGKK